MNKLNNGSIFLVKKKQSKFEISCLLGFNKTIFFEILVIFSLFSHASRSNAKGCVEINRLRQNLMNIILNPIAFECFSFFFNEFDFEVIVVVTFFYSFSGGGFFTARFLLLSFFAFHLSTR